MLKDFNRNFISLWSKFYDFLKKIRTKKFINTQ